MMSQLQRVLDDLDPYQSGFRPGFGMETVMVALVNDLRWGGDLMEGVHPH